MLRNASNRAKDGQFVIMQKVDFVPQKEEGIRYSGDILSERL